MHSQTSLLTIFTSWRVDKSCGHPANSLTHFIFLGFKEYCAQSFETLNFKMDQIMETLKTISTHPTSSAALTRDYSLTRNLPLESLADLEELEDSLSEGLSGRKGQVLVSVGHLFTNFTSLHEIFPNFTHLK